MLARLIAYARGLARRRRIDAEVDEELQFHLDQETQAHVARGLSTTEARRTALRDLGGLMQAREAVREVRTMWFDGVRQDVRYGCRALVRNPRGPLARIEPRQATMLLLGRGLVAIFGRRSKS